MPVASYRTQLGVGLDNANAVLTAAVASGATTIHVSNTNIAASSTIYIIDGANSEVTTVSSGGGTATITVPALANAHPSGVYCASQLTASLGPTNFVPVVTLDVEDKIGQLHDMGLRGNAADVYGSVQGTRWSEITIGGDVYADTFPYFVGAVTGSVDTSGAGPYVYAFALKNTTTCQATPFLLWLYNGIDYRMYAHSKFEQLDITYDPAKSLTYQLKGYSLMSGPVASDTTSYSSVPIIGAWQVAASLGGSAVLYVLAATVSVKRAVSVVSTLSGIQDPYELWQDVQNVTGTMTVVMESNTQLNNFLNNSQPAIDLTWTASGASPAVVKVHLTKSNYETGKPKYVGTKGWVELDISFIGIANSTDATTAGTGLAAAKITVDNAVSAGVYQ